MQDYINSKKYIFIVWRAIYFDTFRKSKRVNMSEIFTWHYLALNNYHNSDIVRKACGVNT